MVLLPYPGDGRLTFEHRGKGRKGQGRVRAAWDPAQHKGPLSVTRVLTGHQVHAQDFPASNPQLQARDKRPRAACLPNPQ